MNSEEIIKNGTLIYSRPKLLNERNTHYCPGCSHGVVHRILAEILEEMGLEDKAIGVAPVGCAVFAYNYIDVDWIEDDVSAIGFGLEGGLLYNLTKNTYIKGGLAYGYTKFEEEESGIKGALKITSWTLNTGLGYRF